MSEAQAIVRLGERARTRGEQLCLATVVHVEGSAYRKPGARMLITGGGERAGTISGGCLEAEVSRKAWWLTAHGARVERYSSFADEDGGMPYGLGCGGVVSLLLERGAPVDAVLAALDRATSGRDAFMLVSALHGNHAGTLAVLQVSATSQQPTPILQSLYMPASLDSSLQTSAELAARTGRSCALDGDFQPTPAGELPAYFVEYLPAAPAITIFGAGEDAQPIAELAHTLGWRITVADGRAHLARPERFPTAAEVRVLDYAAFADPGLRAACGVSAPAVDPVQWQPPPLEAGISLPSDDIAVLVTHSYEQDRALLLALLPRPMRYLGVLGPRHRTERLLHEVAPALGLPVAEAFSRLHSPIGLDLGAGEPAAVALSIVAEVQAVLHGRKVLIERASLSAEQKDGNHESSRVANAPYDASTLEPADLLG